VWRLLAPGGPCGSREKRSGGKKKRSDKKRSGLGTTLAAMQGTGVMRLATYNISSESGEVGRC
jgi:hypothetical protein